MLGTPVLAVTSASFVFDTTLDPGDLADGPDFDVTGVAPVDHGGGCDRVVMVMVDGTGRTTDVDTFCLDLGTGLGGSDGDCGTFDGYVPTVSPVTYTLYDLDAADIAATTGLGDIDKAYVDYVIAHGTCLDEEYFDETDLGIPPGTPFLLCGRVSVVEIPTLSGLGLALAALALAAVALRRLHRRAA